MCSLLSGTEKRIYDRVSKAGMTMRTVAGMMEPWRRGGNESLVSFSISLSPSVAACYNSGAQNVISCSSKSFESIKDRLIILATIGEYLSYLFPLVPLGPCNLEFFMGTDSSALQRWE